MEFTVSFIQLFFWSIYLVSPPLVFLCSVVLVLGQVVSYLEKWTKFDGFYWSFITATTVGYGDIRPLRKVSKILSIFIAFIGVMFTGIIIAVTLNSVEVTLGEYADKSVIEHLKKEHLVQEK